MYRIEHPKPQFERENWLNLNGEWEFEFDFGNSGAESKLYERPIAFSKKINVPFCPQSSLSGVEYRNFIDSVWYRRSVALSSEQCKESVILHFGAVDYSATVYVNGKQCGFHKGGYVSFEIDITEYVFAGNNVIAVHAEDNERDAFIPTGKQSDRLDSYGCFYTRTTGIWQTVWLEFVPKTHIKKVKYYPSVNTVSLNVRAELCGKGTFTVKAYFDGKEMGCASADSDGEELMLNVKLSEKHLWELGKGGLYTLVLTYGSDKVNSYFGLRSIDYRDYRFFLNGSSVFQRLILDQGFYPDGIYTAPKDSKLEADIDLSMAMGFNGARLHQKVFEERFLYHADKKGYIVWGEYPNWGLDHTDEESVYSILPEWLDEIDRDFNHPSIVGWCPFNETWDRNGRKQYDSCLALVYNATKAADPTRPCIDTSGNFHVVTDIYDVHDYEQKVEVFAQHYAGLEKLTGNYDAFSCRQHYDGKAPFFVSEYGGILWSKKTGWGYGEAPKTEEEFIHRLKGLTDVLLDNPRIFAFCYTQLTDVEQEQNGIYTYEREPKFSSEIIKPIISRKAKAEEAF